ncbi:SRPBCC family protein [Homoserinibacter sp. YIM 151385]|uniref:SRPBCC family protein n=1 Tax=Homoserinibacter sp. YIM 151385 TaxID=2985506 RepID=UPI0022F06869|nr:SRPBCC family protein [Homoserinibacter sp. YIM 151385]WBU39087.1 SRPBCC family protein [Homoserinibacter sp. YIM 151385]
MPTGEGSSAEVLVLAPLPDAFRIVTAADPASWYPRFGPLPAVVGVVDRAGAFDAEGDHRRLLLSDGGSVVETLRLVDEPRRFAYDLSHFQKLFGRLVEGARAEWVFAPEGAGTRVRWTYEFHPRRGARLLVRLVVRLWWARYMRRVLPPIAREAGPLA